MSGEVRNTLGLSTMSATCPALCVRFVIRKGWGDFAAIVPAPRRDRRLGLSFFLDLSSDLYYSFGSTSFVRSMRGTFVALSPFVRSSVS